MIKHMSKSPSVNSVNLHYVVAGRDRSCSAWRLPTEPARILATDRKAGDSWCNGVKLKLAGGARFEIEMQWGSTGWSVPATFG